MRTSTARGREFGAGLRKALADAGLTSRQAAGIVNWDEAKISNLVNGKGGATQLEVALLLGVCGAKADEVVRLLTLHRERNVRGWWQQHGTCSPVSLRTVADHVKVATTMTCWHAHMVPLFLQTTGYMREVLRASSTASPDELEERVHARIALQALVRPDTRCDFVVHELALHLPVGGAEIYAEQLLHLMSMANRPNIGVRIVPMALGAHAGLAGPFTRLMFGRYQPLVWVETENSSLFAEKDDAIEGYGRVVRALEDSSLDEDTSRDLILGLYDAL